MSRSLFFATAALVGVALSGSAVAGEVLFPPFLTTGSTHAPTVANVHQILSSELDFRSEFSGVKELSKRPGQLGQTCLGSSSCLRGVLRGAGGDALVVGSMSQDKGTVKLDLVFFDGTKIVRRKDFTLQDDSESIADGMTAVVQELITGKTQAETAEEEPSVADFEPDELEDLGDWDADDFASAAAEQERVEREREEERKRQEKAARRSAERAALVTVGFDREHKAEQERRREAEEEARRRAEEEERRRQEEEEAQRKAEEEERRRAEEEERRRAEAEERKRQEEEERLAREKADKERKDREAREAREEEERLAREKADKDERLAREKADRERAEREARAEETARREKAEKAEREREERGRDDAVASADDEEEFDPNAISFGEAEIEVQKIDANEWLAGLEEDGGESSSSGKSDKKDNRAKQRDKDREKEEKAQARARKKDDAEREKRDKQRAREEASLDKKPRKDEGDDREFDEIGDEPDEFHDDGRYDEGYDDDPDEAVRQEEPEGEPKADKRDRRERRADRGGSADERDDRGDDRSDRGGKGDASSEARVEEKPRRRPVEVKLRGGYSFYYSLGFITYGGEVALPAGNTGLYFLAGAEAYSTQREIPGTGSAQPTTEWNTIIPFNAGVAYKIKSKVFQPYFGADFIAANYYTSADRKASWALGGRARIGSDIMIVRNFGFNIDVAVGYWQGRDWVIIQQDLGAHGVIPRASLGATVAF